MTVVLVTGGTRSGKSAVAERLLGADATYVATASATDPEMADRIAAHRARRPASWRTTGDLDLPPSGDVLVDGLGTWIAGELHRGGAFDGADLDPLVAAIRARLAVFTEAVAARTDLTVVVVEQAGAAPIAADRVTRRWVDLVGEAAQQIGAVADRALLVVAGRTVDLPEGGQILFSHTTFRCDEGSEPANTDTPDLGAGKQDLTPRRGRRPVHGDRMVPPGHEDFAVNVVGDAPPAWMRAALERVLDGVGAYPDERDAVAAVARRHGRDAGEVLALNGAAEGFWLLAAALRPRRAVVVAPAFTEAVTALRAHGHDPALVERVPDDADLVVLANPANPTGALTARTTIEALIRPGRTVVVDEAFMDLVAGEPETVSHRRDVVVLRSLTKSLAIPGVRAGYLLGDPELVARLDAHRQPWSVNAFALAALHAWAEHPDPTSAIAAEVARRRRRLTDALRALDLEVGDAAANFVLVRVPDGPRVLAGLRERRIAVRPTTDFGLSADHLRIAVRDDAATDRLRAALAEILTEETA